MARPGVNVQTRAAQTLGPHPVRLTGRSGADTEENAEFAFGHRGGGVNVSKERRRAPTFNPVPQGTRTETEPLTFASGRDTDTGAPHAGFSLKPYWFTSTIMLLFRCSDPLPCPPSWGGFCFYSMLFTQNAWPQDTIHDHQLLSQRQDTKTDRLKTSETFFYHLVHNSGLIFPDSFLLRASTL